jgi:hypothetical protein
LKGRLLPWHPVCKNVGPLLINAAGESSVGQKNDADGPVPAAPRQTAPTRFGAAPKEAS